MVGGTHSGYQTILGSVPSDWAEHVPYSRTLVKGTAVFIFHFYCPWTRAYLMGKGVPLSSDPERGKEALPLIFSKAAAAPLCDGGVLWVRGRPFQLGRLGTCSGWPDVLGIQLLVTFRSSWPTNKTDFKVQASSKQHLNKTVCHLSPVDYSMCRQ